MAVLYKKQSRLYVFCKMTFLCTTGFVLSSIIFLLLLPTLVFFWFISKFIYFLIWIKLGNKFDRPSGMDIIQGLESEKSRPFINMVGRFEGKCNFEVFAKKFHEEIMQVKNKRGEFRYKKFGQIFEKHFGYHVFRNAENFDIKDRIMTVDIKTLFPEKNFYSNELYDSKVNPVSSIETPGPPAYIKYQETKNNETREKLIPVEWEVLVERILDKYGSRGIEPGCPKWELILVQEEEHWTMVFRMHHSYCDGVYFMRFIMEYFGDTPVECKLPYNFHQPNFLKRWGTYLWAFCMMPYGLFRMSFRYDKNPLHGPKLSGKKMYLLSKPVHLDILKEIKAESKTSINSILFSCLSFAISSHFKKKKALLDKVFAVVPVSLQDLDRPIKLRNKFGLVGVLLPTFMDKNEPFLDKLYPPSCYERLQEIHDFLTYSISDPSFLAIHWLVLFISYLFPSRLLNIVFTSKGLTSSMSNVVGPQNDELIFCERRTTEFSFWVPDRNPLGMGVSISGYKGLVRIGLMADKALMQSNREGYDFLENFEKEILAMYTETKDRRKGNYNETLSEDKNSKAFESEESRKLKNIP